MLRAELEKREIIEIAKKIIRESPGPICNHCLGRQFAKVSSGVSNERRGEVLKEILRAVGEEIESGKCWLCNGLFENDNLDEWVRAALAKLKQYEYDTFLVGTKMSGMLMENEEMMWEIAGALFAEPLKAELNREVGKRIEQETGKRVDFDTPEVVVILNLWSGDFDVELQVKPLFIYGRYRKYRRGIPQTRWFCRACHGKGCERCNFTGKMYAESVEELIKGSIMDVYGAEDVILHGCGREDIDARMLGSGRPFVVELRAPKRRQRVDLHALEEKVNEENRAKLEVTNLKYVNREMVARIKNANARKTYRMRVELRGAVTESKLREAVQELDGAVIEQRTPLRVVHRRADLIRSRRIYGMKLLNYGGSTCELEVKCDGGLYVKELISGDRGRTRPNLSDLLGTGIEAEVKELDVIDVELDTGHEITEATR